MGDDRPEGESTKQHVVPNDSTQSHGHGDGSDDTDFHDDPADLRVNSGGQATDAPIEGATRSRCIGEHLLVHEEPRIALMVVDRIGRPRLVVAEQVSNSPVVWCETSTPSLTCMLQSSSTRYSLENIHLPRVGSKLFQFGT
ncbi:hypothetical protein ACQP0C_32070 [Nocardia sp. CA-129566]|uniref:hypothetical protein n=1 Tax=Nocardia sp. CA-129566 TaxID=3239976 RepID=UPI003D98C30E